MLGNPVRPTALLALLALFGAPGGAFAWEGAEEPLVEDRVLTLTVREKGWSVGGVSADRLGSVYVADFAETVWKVAPDGEVTAFATGLYGASGNAVDRKGHLFQSSFHADTVSRIDRAGEVSTWVSEGLDGPVGVAVADDGTLWVCNCRGNTVTEVSPEREVRELASLAGFTGCANGITLGPDGDLYVIGFGRSVILKVTREGEVSRFTEIPGGWLAHLAFAGGHFYVTSIGTHEVYRVDPAGEVEVLTGTPERRVAGGSLRQARFSSPNGIAASPSAQVLYVNSLDTEPALPGRGRAPAPLVLSRIELMSFSEKLVAALDAGGVDAAAAAYRDYKRDHAEENTERTVNFLGYWLLTRQRHDDAIAVFELNAESYPGSANVWDSLAEGHLRRGDRDRAVELYEKSLALDPGNESAKRKLASLGVK